MGWSNFWVMHSWLSNPLFPVSYHVRGWTFSAFSFALSLACVDPADIMDATSNEVLRLPLSCLRSLVSAGTTMFTGATKIVKPEGQEADEFEQTVAQELFNLEVRE